MHWETGPGREPKPWQTMLAALRAKCHEGSKLVWNSSTDKRRAVDTKPIFHKPCGYTVEPCPQRRRLKAGVRNGHYSRMFCNNYPRQEAWCALRVAIPNVFWG